MKSLKALLGLGLLVAAVYVAYELIPPYFHNYQFQDVLESEARLNSYSSLRKTEDEIREGIVTKARDLDIILQPEQVTVTRAGTEWVISADYTVHVDLALHPVDLEFHPSSRGK